MKNNAVLQVGPLMPTVQDSITSEYGAVRLARHRLMSGNEFLQQHGGSFEVAVTSGKVGVGPGADARPAEPSRGHQFRRRL